MRKFSLICRNRSYLLLIFLVVVLIFPNNCLAEDNEINIQDFEKYLELPEGKVEKLILSLINVFHSEWMDLEASGYSSAEERAVPNIILKTVKIEALNHLLVEAPIDVVWGIIKGALKIAKLIGTKTADISAIINEFEKESVKKAIAYGMKALFENDIRVTPGAIEFKYISKDKEEKIALIQYLSIYKPIDKKSGNLEIRFYSPNFLVPPENRGSPGGTLGLYTDLTTNLPPFVVNIQGRAENYKWVEKPIAKIEFPSEVPDLGIRPINFLEKKLLKPIEGTIKEVEIIITKVTGKPLGLFKFWKEIKKFLAEINPLSPASLFNNSPVNQIPQQKETQESLSNPEKYLPVAEPAVDAPVVKDPLQQLLPKPEPVVQEEVFVEIQPKQTDDIEETVVLKEGLIESVEVKPQQEIEKKVVLCEKNNEAIRDKVIFNEIAWMGTNNFSSDEWFELKNISDSDIDLKGWQVLDGEKQIKIIFEEGIIPAKGYFLLERTDDQSVPNIPADFIYTGALNDNKEILYLFNQDCRLMDEVAADPAWPAGEKGDRRSMERDENFEWYTYTESGEGGILGTPAKANSPKIIIPVSNNISPPPPPSPPPISQPEPPKEEEEIDSQPPQILITEVQIKASSSADYDFIEFYNPSTSSIDISGFQLKKRNSKGSETSVKVFSENSIILARDYFLWANSEYASLTAILADSTSSQTLAGNNSVVLFSSNGVVIDAVSWGSSTEPFVEAESFLLNPEEDQTIGRKWSDEISGYIDSNNNQADFEIQMPTPKVKNQTLTILVNELPSAQFFYNPSNPLINEEVVLDASSSSDPDGAIAEYFWDFGDGLSTSSVEVSISHVYNNSGSFIVKLEVVDDEGATSSAISLISITEPVENPSLAVVINEIAWMGTSAANSNDEWIELYNNTDSLIDLTGWQLTAEDGTPSIIFPTSTIAVKSYFLLERTDNDTVSDISADMIYTGALGNEGEKLELRDVSGILIDVIDCSDGWFGGTIDSRYISMERIISGSSGTTSSNWASNNLIAKNGKDADKNKINGSPKTINSVSRTSTGISGTVDYPVLTYLGSPYAVWGSLEIPLGFILTIEPGVILEFDNNANLEITGTLKAIGEKNRKIIFTSSNPPQYWKGIRFNKFSLNSELAWTDIKYARRTAEKPSILIEESSIIYRDSILSDYDFRGLILKKSSSTIERVSFLGSGFSVSGVGIKINGGSSAIRDCDIKGNNQGIFIEELSLGDLPIIENNNFEENKVPIYAFYPAAVFKSNHGQNNQKGIILINGKIDVEELVWYKNEFPYVVEGVISVNEEKILIIEPGVVVKFYDEAYLSISGTLLAQGTEEENIIFTAFGGFWKAIYFDWRSKNSLLENVIISKGGGFNVLRQVDIKGCAVEIKNSSFTDGINSGIYLTNSSSTIQNTYFGNQIFGIKIYGTEASPQLGEGITFENNTAFDIYVEGGDWCSSASEYLRTSKTNCSF